MKDFLVALNLTAFCRTLAATNGVPMKPHEFRKINRNILSDLKREASYPNKRTDEAKAS